MNIPVVSCKGEGDRWVFWCPFCKMSHVHSPERGHRVAHCVDFDVLGRRIDSPYREAGYILELEHQ